MNKKLLLALIGAALVTTASYSSEKKGDEKKELVTKNVTVEGQQPAKQKTTDTDKDKVSFGKKLGNGIKDTISWVRHNIFNFPNAIAQHFGYGKQMNLLLQAGIAVTFWALVAVAAKQAYDKYKEYQAKKNKIDDLEEIKRLAQSDYGVEENA